MSVDPAGEITPAGVGTIVSEDERSSEILIAQHSGFEEGYGQGRKDQRTGQVLWLFLLLLPVIWAASYVYGESIRQSFANILFALAGEIGVGAIMLLVHRD